METLLFQSKSVTLSNTIDNVVLGGNMRRKRIAFQSNNANIVFVNFGKPAMDASTAGNGFEVNSGKQALMIENPPVEEVHAVAGVAGSILTIMEWFTK